MSETARTREAYLRTEMHNRLMRFATVIPVEREYFDTERDTLHAPFGYLPCEREGDQLVFFYSPAIIIEQTAHLTDQELATYVHTLSLHVSMHVTHPDVDPAEVERMIDRGLYDLDPHAMQLVNDIQMRVHD